MTSLSRISVVETVGWEGEFLISSLDFSMNYHLSWVTCSLESWIFVKYTKLMIYWASLVAQMVKNPLAICGKPGFDPWVWKIPWRRAWQPTLVFLLRESHGQRSLSGYSPWGRKESDTSERLSPAQWFIRYFPKFSIPSFMLSFDFIALPLFLSRRVKEATSLLLACRIGKVYLNGYLWHEPVTRDSGTKSPS